ncbi:MAG: hypothetical protein GX029_13060 [Pseudomonadaceae bacterium]|nr:hypothetical protein [Pseudomonadaceae bacterium]
MTTTNLTQLAQFALNQLLSGVELSEAYENLSIYERLGDVEEHHFLAELETQSMKLGMVIGGETLRPMTKFEVFANNASSDLVAYHSNHGVRLEDFEQSVTFSLDDIPETIINERLPVAVIGLLAKVYFLAKGSA